jgi:hypothetical protein
MSTITDLIATYLGTYDFSVRWDIPYIVAAGLLLLGVWFAFKVVLAIIYLLGGKR